MRALLFTAPIVLLLGTAGAATEPPTWQLFSSEDGRFQILLPEIPVVTHKSRSTFVGDILETKLATTVGSHEASIEHHDIPSIATQLMPDQVILDQAGDSLIEAVGGTQSLDRAYTWNGFAAREITYEVPGDTPMLERTRLILVGTRLYLVAASWPAPQDIPATLVAFLDSFALKDATAPVSAGTTD